MDPQRFSHPIFFFFWGFGFLINDSWTESVPVKTETGSEDDYGAPTSKTPKCNDAVDGSSDVGEGSVVGSDDEGMMV